MKTVIAVYSSWKESQNEGEEEEEEGTGFLTPNNPGQFTSNRNTKI